MHAEQHIAAVILAAGASTRFGSPKQLARLGGRTMLEIVAETATAAGLDPVIVVVPSAIPPPPGTVAVVNDVPSEGLSRSLRLGLAHVPAEADAAVVLLGDQPTVSVDLLTTLLNARGGSSVVATESDGRLGPPAVLERDAFALAHGVRGDRGLRDVLRRGGERVTAVPLGAGLLDVDEPSDLEAVTEACPGCGGRFLPHRTDETHAYIGASPACWAAFGELLAREFGDPAYGRVHRHTVDVYAAQHPGEDDRRQRQSVALHLVGICHWLEHDLAADRLNAITQRLANEERDWPWLSPPQSYPMTVIDVLGARDGADHVREVRRWAELTWEAWREHHDLVRGWAREALA